MLVVVAAVALLALPADNWSSRGGGSFSGGTLTSPLSLDGTNTACSDPLALRWANDTNTGLQRSAADTIDACVGAAMGLRIAPLVLTVPGDLVVDTNTLVVDDNVNMVGIGIALPLGKLHIDDTVAGLLEMFIRNQSGSGHSQIAVIAGDTNNANRSNFNIRAYGLAAAGSTLGVANAGLVHMLAQGSGGGGFGTAGVVVGSVQNVPFYFGTNNTLLLTMASTGFTFTNGPIVSSGNSVDITTAGNEDLTLDPGGTGAVIVDATYLRHPRYISATPVKPTCDAAAEGGEIYVDDTDDAIDGGMCTCNDTAAGGALAWRMSKDDTTACPGT